MSKRIGSGKLLSVWTAVAAVVIIAGIILFALLGFNHSAERPGSKTFEVTYDVVLEIGEKETALQEACEKAFSDAGISYGEKVVLDSVSGNPPTQTGDKTLRYTFAADTADEALKAAAAAVEAVLDQEGYAESETSVAYHTLRLQSFGDAAWRGAVALAAGAVVALIYIAIRFGIGSALAGLTVCAHDALFTLALFAITRIPVYSFGPLLYAGIAAVISLLLWVLRAMKLRENAKEPASAALSAEEAVARSCADAKWWMLCTVIALGAVLVVFGAVAAAGMRLFVLPALIPVAVCTYSALTFAPALQVPVKAAFDKINRKNKQRYVGKKKAEDAQKD